MRASIRWSWIALVGAISASPLVAQVSEGPKDRLFRTIDWASGPVTGGLGSEAEVEVPAACRFTGASGAKTFMEVTENPATGKEQGILLCPAADTATGPWFVVFSYDASGYVRDDEGQSLDADAIMKALQEGTEQANNKRWERGWEPIHLLGWERPPFYDPSTHNLTWSTRIQGTSGSVDVNHSVRLLGRGGVMHADLVAGRVQLATAVPAFDAILARYHFKTGRAYAEWRSGDKVAEYGLTALIAGGVGAAAVKTGLLGKFWRVLVAVGAAAWKFLVALAAGVAAWVRSVFQRKKGKAGGGAP